MPVIALFDTIGKAAKNAPEQISATCVKVGTTTDPLTVIVKSAVVAH